MMAYQLSWMIGLLAAISAPSYALQTSVDIDEDSITAVHLAIPNEFQKPADLTQIEASCGCISIALKPCRLLPHDTCDVIATIDGRLRHNDFTVSVRPDFRIDDRVVTAQPIRVLVHFRTWTHFSPNVPAVFRCALGDCGATVYMRRREGGTQVVLGPSARRRLDSNLSSPPGTGFPDLRRRCCRRLFGARLMGCAPRWSMMLASSICICGHCQLGHESCTIARSC
jgi:hypothetical protein